MKQHDFHISEINQAKLEELASGGTDEVKLLFSNEELTPHNHTPPMSSVRLDIAPKQGEKLKQAIAEGKDFELTMTAKLYHVQSSMGKLPKFRSVGDAREFKFHLSDHQRDRLRKEHKDGKSVALVIPAHNIGHGDSYLVDAHQARNIDQKVAQGKGMRIVFRPSTEGGALFLP